MQEQAVERRLTAILAADMVGYSRLMERDERDTLARLEELRREVLDPAFERHRGRLVKSMGDGLLVEFASVVDAVACAVEVQDALAKRAESVPSHSAIRFRIGVNLGDVMVRDDDLFGDGVNIAARIEGLAEPGTVCLSGTAYDQVRNKLNVSFVQLGQRRVKNITEPVRVYRVLRHGERLPARPLRLFRSSTARWAIAGFAVVAAAAGAVVLLDPFSPPADRAERERMAWPLPDEPSLAVLPFTNISDDPAQDYFAEGMTDDLITDLSQLPGIFVIASQSSFSFAERAVSVREAAEALGVRYVLSGSVRRDADRLRINAQLVDALSGGHVWAERFDGTFDDVLAFEDQVIEQIVAELAVSIQDSPAAVEGRAGTDSPQAYDAFLRGWSAFRRGEPDDYAEAVVELERAIALDSEYGRAYAALAMIYTSVIGINEATGTSAWSRRLGLSTDEVLQRQEQLLAVAMEDPGPLAYQVSSARLLRQGLHEEALDQAEMAVALAPNDPESHRAAAVALVYSGEPSAAADHISTAIRLDPLFPHEYRYWLGLAEFGMGQFEDAVRTLGAAIGGNPNDDRSMLVLAAALGHLGRVGEAAAAVQGANAIRAERQLFGDDVQPGVDVLLAGPYSLQDLQLWPFAKDEDRERIAEGLRRAGVPDVGAVSDVSPLDIVGATTVDAAGAKALFDDGAMFIDVRGEGQWASGHIPGAAHLDLSDGFSEQTLVQVASKQDPIVIYCMGPRCLLSSRGCAQAVEWGFESVYYFREGFPAWKAAGFDVAQP